MEKTATLGTAAGGDTMATVTILLILAAGLAGALYAATRSGAPPTPGEARRSR